MEEDKEKKNIKKESSNKHMSMDKLLKEKIIIFAIGLLVGAIVATTGCIIYNKINHHNKQHLEQQNYDPRTKEDWKYRHYPNMNENIPNSDQKEYKNFQDKRKNIDDKNEKINPSGNN